MKTKCFRLLTVFLTAVMFVALSVNVYAASSNAVTKDGLTAQLFTDKDVYKADESVKATVSVDNHSGKEVFVSVSVNVPDGVAVEGSTVYDAVLQNGEIWTTSDGITMSASDIASIGSAAATGDNMQVGYWIILTVLAVGGIIAFIVYGKNRKTWVSMMICLAMIGGLVTAAIPVQAADVSGSMEVNCIIQVDGKDAEVSATVNYVIYDYVNEKNEAEESVESTESGETTEPSEDAGVPSEGINKPSEPSEEASEPIEPGEDTSEEASEPVDPGEDTSEEASEPVDPGEDTSEEASEPVEPSEDTSEEASKPVEPGENTSDPSDDDEPTEDDDSPTIKLFYHNDFEDESRALKDGANVFKKNQSIQKSANGEENDYAIFEYINAEATEKDYFMEAFMENCNVENLIVELDVSTAGKMSAFKVEFPYQYKANSSTSTDKQYFFEVSKDGSLIINGKSYTDIIFAKDSWVKLAFKYNLKTGECIAYVNGEERDTYNLRPVAENFAIDIMRIYLASSNEPGNTLYIDNFAVYEGLDFTDVSGLIPEKAAGNQYDATVGTDVAKIPDADGNYAKTLMLTQTIIDEAVACYKSGWPANNGIYNPAEKSACALYYLTLATHLDPNAKATDGTLCKDAAIGQLKYLVAGGHEPFACVGCYWGHAVVASSLVLLQETPAIYDELDDDTKDRMDWLMKALAIAGNWGYNDANDYSTGFDLLGNFGKTWNPNYKNTYLSIILSASMYFDYQNIDIDTIFINFEYDEYINKFEELGFTNILATWTTVDSEGKSIGEYMENGGSCYLLGGIGQAGDAAGDYGGTGKGVKQEFAYTVQVQNDFVEAGTVLRTENTIELFMNLLYSTYTWNVINGYGTPETANHAYILSGKESPFTGQMGMMKEFAGGDSKGIRSRCDYCYDSFEILMTVYANMKLLEGWDSSTDAMQKLDNRVYVGTEDMMFKMAEGYHGYSNGKQADEYEYQYEVRGYRFIKDIWKNFHCKLGEDVTTISNPNATVLAAIPTVEPKDNVTTDAWPAVLLDSDATFTEESYYDIDGGNLKSGNVEFDVVIGDGINVEAYDTVVMLAKKEDKIGWAKANMLIQFQYGVINIRNGSSYVKTGVRFGANYRYHVDAGFDVDTRKYTVTIKQTYPVTDDGSFTYTTPTEYTTNPAFDFRTNASAIDYVDSVAIVKSHNDFDMWVENFKLNTEADVTPTEPIEPTETYYYNQDYNADDFDINTNANAWPKEGNTITVEKSGDNGYIKLAKNFTGTKDSQYNINLTNPQLGDIIVEMKLCKGNFAAPVRLDYRHDGTTKYGGVLFNVQEDGTVRVGETEIAKLTENAWTHLAFKLNLTTGSFEAIVDGTSKGSFTTAKATVAPTFMRFYMSSVASAAASTYVDDVAVYPGTELRTVQQAGAVPTQPQLPTFYVQNNFNVNMDGVNAWEKTNKIERIVDANNGYISMRRTAVKVDDYMVDININDMDTLDNLVVEFDVSAGDAVPANGRVNYKSVAGDQNLLFIGEGGVLYTTSSSDPHATLKNGDWVKIGFIIDYTKESDNCQVYVNDFETPAATLTVKRCASSKKFLRIYMPSSNAVDTSLLLDNLRIYSGTQFLTE